MNPSMLTVDGFTVNSWHVFTFRKSSVMLMAIQSTVQLTFFLRDGKIRIGNCWWLSRHKLYLLNMSTVDGSAINSWHVLLSKNSKCENSKIGNSWWLSSQRMTSLKVVICWRLNHQNLHTFIFSILKTCQLLTLEPST